MGLFLDRLSLGSQRFFPDCTLSISSPVYSFIKRATALRDKIIQLLSHISDKKWIWFYFLFFLPWLRRSS